MIILLVKLLAAPALILVATLVSRRFGQATGGWLVGLPLTSGPIAVLLAVEQGPRFAQLAAAGSLGGTVAQAIFATAYVGLAQRWRWPVCLVGASLAFVASGLVLASLALPVSALAGIACVTLAGTLWTIGPPGADATVSAAPKWDLPVRMAVATGLVMLITAVAPAIGPGSSGLAATFPLFATVLAVFAHRHHGAPAAHGVLRGLLLGLFGFVGFFATVSVLVTQAGLAATFTAALAVNLVISAAAYPVLRSRSD